MPELPTLTVTSQQGRLLMDVFGTPENYRAWLAATIRQHVGEHYRRTRQRQAAEQIEADVQALLDDLP